MECLSARLWLGQAWIASSRSLRPRGEVALSPPLPGSIGFYMATEASSSQPGDAWSPAIPGPQYMASPPESLASGVPGYGRAATRPQVPRLSSPATAGAISRYRSPAKAIWPLPLATRLSILECLRPSSE